jgi:uncharacterized protein YcbX
MRGEDLSRAWVTYAGLAGDRVYAFVDPEKAGNFPWLTARQVPELLRFTPSFVDPPEETLKYPSRERWRVRVRTPEGEERDLEDPAFHRELAARFGRPLELRFSERGMQDARPVSLFGLPTLRLLEEEVGIPLDPRRFRANFYVEWSSGRALHEEGLVGRTLQLGEKLRVLIDKKDPRCLIVNLDPDTAEAGPEVLKTVGKLHKGCIGVYAVVVAEGVVAKDDPVFLF